MEITLSISGTDGCVTFPVIVESLCDADGIERRLRDRGVRARMNYPTRTLHVETVLTPDPDGASQALLDAMHDR